MTSDPVALIDGEAKLEGYDVLCIVTRRQGIKVLAASPEMAMGEAMKFKEVIWPIGIRKLKELPAAENAPPVAATDDPTCPAVETHATPTEG